MLATSAAVAFQNTPATGPGERPISIDRITRSSVPAAPSVISLKIQPIHRIAKEAHTSGVREQEYTKATRSIDNGLLWLGAHQEPSGLWRLRNTATPTDEPDNPTSVDLAITALAVKAFAQRGLASSHLDKGIAALLNEIDRQGGFHGGEGTALGTYVSATVASALATLDDPRYEDQLEQALTWLKEEQWSDQDGLVPEQDWFGGVGYGNRGRPDLSNTQMMLDALYDAGICPDDPAAQRALVFVSRTQNLKTTNGAQWAQAGSNDGGFIYTPANGGESMGSEYAGEGRYGELLPPDAPRQLRSYGSMTYAGFKSLLHAGLNEEDPRVSAALDWIKANWTFAENPGAGKQGVYYYRHALGRTMQVSGMEQIVTTDGIAHPWRSELIAALIADQNEEGYWINPEPRWLEGEKTLATCYAILALEEALKGSGRLSDPLETPESDSSDE
jgi:squalene-hopene/tetraprenyl-beta-curcumene cyclase